MRARSAVLGVCLVACGQPASPAPIVAETSAQPVATAPATASASVGHLAPEEIQRVVHRERDFIQACYRKAQAAAPELRGTVHVELTIDRVGRVPAARDLERPTDAPPTKDALPAEVSACVVGIMRTLVFPAPRGGEVVHVKWPFHFYPPDPRDGSSR